uniref:Uncharacterized protein n=1 Tax=Timema poppense TaxID=170557 RepID=A0A7R9GX01_TIMPO|nr:unnamed protein product [Timema poppensis]
MSQLTVNNDFLRTPILLQDDKSPNLSSSSVDVNATENEDQHVMINLSNNQESHHPIKELLPEHVTMSTKTLRVFKVFPQMNHRMLQQQYILATNRERKNLNLLQRKSKLADLIAKEEKMFEERREEINNKSLNTIDIHVFASECKRLERERLDRELELNLYHQWRAKQPIFRESSPDLAKVDLAGCCRGQDNKMEYTVKCFDIIEDAQEGDGLRVLRPIDTLRSLGP